MKNYFNTNHTLIHICTCISFFQLYFEAKDYYIKKPRVSTPQTGTLYTGTVYELCLCESGRLFLSKPNSDCKATAAICQ